MYLWIGLTKILNIEVNYMEAYKCYICGKYEDITGYDFHPKLESTLEQIGTVDLCRDCHKKVVGFIELIKNE